MGIMRTEPQGDGSPGAPERDPAGVLTVNGVSLVALPSGALWWPERRTLVVADLHLEKGSAFAARGVLLPPYDSARTLDRLAAEVARTGPEVVICLGDSFHDSGAAGRLAPDSAARLARLAADRRWIWVAGNHDPEPPRAPGEVLPEVTLGALTFRHEARRDRPGAGEVSGHFHPKASVVVRARLLSRPCFVSDGRRLLLPAFGAYTGGLDVHEPAIRGLWSRPWAVHLTGQARIYRLPAARLAARSRRPA